ncbi:acetamidase/formamidase family protein [Patulibacter defluvii]|uniref:acetamidase/formamidase family protein n=1 Tax=Patulibacter defluvii TaxID=3095358 RepID=UPI002A74EB8B|nr:acetamidase/formamidase family protein [Patulibacter sp. DM4]
MKRTEQPAATIHFDRALPLADTPGVGHNRWHPEISPVLTVRPGDVVELDVRDGLDGQISPGMDAQAMLALLAGTGGGRGLPMTGPIAVDGAEPGDLVEITLLSFEPSATGWTGVFPDFTVLGPSRLDPFLVTWTIEDGVARTEAVPGVAIPARPLLGLVGVAPSRESLARINEAEARSAARGGGGKRPSAEGAVPDHAPIATDGLHPEPSRRIGGNIDLNLLGLGSRLLLPVDVPGALVSVGDAHFAQGDGESLASAIEVSARVRLRLDLRKAEGLAWKPTRPAVEIDDRTPLQTGRRWIATTGLSLDEAGRGDALDLSAALRGALDELVGYLVDERGFAPEQAAVIVGVAAELRLSQVVNPPNAMVTALLPLEIFDACPPEAQPRPGDDDGRR